MPDSELKIDVKVQEIIFIGHLLSHAEDMPQYATLVEQVNLFKTTTGKHMWKKLYDYYMRYKNLPKMNNLQLIGFTEDEEADVRIAIDELNNMDSDGRFSLDTFMDTIQLGIYRNATEAFETALQVGGEDILTRLRTIEDLLISQLLICRNADKTTKHGTLSQTVMGWLEGRLPFQLPRVAIPIPGMENIAGSPVGSVNLLVGGYGSGKGNPKNMMFTTPIGVRKWGDLKAGDYVFGVNGKPTKVIQTFDLGLRDVYRVTFDDGSFMDCTEDHLHYVYGRKSRRFDQRRGWGKVSWKVLTTKEIIEEGVTLKHGKCTPLRQWEVPRIKPVEFITKPDLPVSSYALGLWLGDGAPDGSISINALHTTVHDYLQQNYVLTGCRLDTKKSIKIFGIKGFPAGLRKLGVFGLRSWEKYIPQLYLESSVEDRIELFKGLMDSDGECDHNGATVVYSSVSKQLVDDVATLARGLGCKVSYYTPKLPTYTYQGEVREGRISYRINIAVPDYIGCPFRSIPKRAERYRGVSEERYLIRWIDKIEKLDHQEECMCIKVDSEDELYLANDFIPTHNTTTMASMTSYLLKKYDVLYVTLETNADAIVFKILSNLTEGKIRAKAVYEKPDSEKVNDQERQIMEDIKIAYENLQSSTTNDSVIKITLPTRNGESDQDLHTLYHLTMSPGMATAAQLELYAREIERKSGRKLDAIMVDYAALMRTNSGGSKEEVGWSYTGTVMMELSAVAQNLGIVIWTAAQSGGNVAHTVTSTATNAFKPLRGADVYGSKEILQNGSLVYGLSFVRSSKYPHLAAGVLSTLKNRYGVEFYDYLCTMNYGLAQMKVISVCSDPTEGEGGLVDKVYNALKIMEKNYEMSMYSRMSQATLAANNRRGDQKQSVQQTLKENWGVEFNIPEVGVGLQEINLGMDGYSAPTIPNTTDVPLRSKAEDKKNLSEYDSSIVKEGTAQSVSDNEDKGGQVTTKNGYLIRTPRKAPQPATVQPEIIPQTVEQQLLQEQEQAKKRRSNLLRNTTASQKTEVAQRNINQSLGIRSSTDLPI